MDNMDNFGFTKKSGILMAVSSLPSPYGIGTFGKPCYRWIDFLASTKTVCWQVLPLNPTAYGDSPYQSPAADAGNPYFIDLDDLQALGLLTKEELQEAKHPSGNVDYGWLFYTRFDLLRKAYRRFKGEAWYTRFCRENEWVEDYASGTKFSPAYFRSGLEAMSENLELYEKNVFSIRKEFTFEDKPEPYRVDLALFLNGIPIVMIELNNWLTVFGSPEEKQCRVSWR